MGDILIYVHRIGVVGGGGCGVGFDEDYWRSNLYLLICRRSIFCLTEKRLYIYAIYTKYAYTCLGENNVWETRYLDIKYDGYTTKVMGVSLCRNNPSN